MLYRTYQLQEDLAAPWRSLARFALPLLEPTTWGLREGACSPVDPLRRRVAATVEMLSRAEITHTRPPFGVTSTIVDGSEVAVTEEVVLDLPFGRLLRFRKEAPEPQPKVLIVAALSGHFSTLLRATVETMVADNDVYITDWANARDVPLEAGRFGVDEYVEYVIRFLEEIGPGNHVVAVCQPAVQALVAAAIMNEDENPAAPRTLTLMAGPIDVRLNPTRVNELALEKPIEWFERNVIETVPRRYAGRGRRVYPGFVQLTAFVSMNPRRHIDQHRALYRHLANGEEAEAEAIKTFYDEYFAVLDISAEFYLETVERVFMNAELPKGEFHYRDRLVDLSKITRTSLLTVEGERDDICGLGQTAAAQDLCTGLRPNQRRHHLQPGVGHYGVFSGRRWNKEIYPVVNNFILGHV